jgi:HEAT repeat protein
LSWRKEVATGNDYEDIPMKKKHLFYLLASLLMLSAGGVRADEEQDLITLLKSNAGVPQKCDACFRLRLVGTAESVPALASLLGQERLSQAARNALEVMPYSEAGQALRQAMSDSAGSIKAGLIDSLGARGDAQAVPLLKPLLADADVVVASASACALGKIGGDEAVTALQGAAGKATTQVRPVVLEALLQCAERSQAPGIYRGVFNGDFPTEFRAAAWRGLVLSDADNRKALLTKALSAPSHPARRAALKLIRALDDAQVVEACVQQWDSLAADVQLAVLDASVRQGGKALPLVRTALKSPHPAVQVAALDAAGCVGDAKLAAVLAEQAASGTEAQQTAARRSLRRLSGEGVDRAILSQTSASNPAVQVEAIDALRERGAAIDVAGGPLLNHAKAGAPQVQRAALRALGDLAGAEQMPDFVTLLIAQKQGGPADDAVKALVATARRA